MFAYGSNKSIHQIHELITQEHPNNSEITVLDTKNNTSVLTVSRAKSIFEIDEAIHFFKGWFQDHESRGIVLGGNGFEDWVKDGVNRELVTKTDYEGAYVSAIFSDEKLSVRNDTFSYLPVIHFSSKKLFVCSDSMYIISEVRKALGMPCKLNKKVMHSRAWTHGLACAVMSNQTQIEGVELLSPGKHIEIDIQKKMFSSAYLLETKNIVKSANLKQAFAIQFENYH